MKKENKKVEKLCSFYVSNWHLATMILPYINSKIEENTKIITILENSIEENIQKLIEKLNLKNKEKILSIKWSKLDSQKYEDIEKKLKKEIIAEKQNIILVNGCSNYIQSNNCNIEQYLKKSKAESIKIINFFEVTEFNNHIIDILDAHDKVFNTSGEKEITEIFEGYVKGEKLPTKKVVGGMEE